MLSARGRLLRPERPPGWRRRAVAVTMSVVLHAAALGLLLPHAGRSLPLSLPPLEVELVRQPAEQQGAPPPPQAPAPKPAPAPSAPAAPAAANPAAPPVPQAPQPQPATAAAAKPSRPPQQAAPEVNLGSAMRDVDPLTVTGENVVPPAPDARYRNLPPHYPPAAARIGAEGIVELVVHVAPGGQALGIDVSSSSGNADLDAEARRAVLLWHFRPARLGGRPVSYDYVINIRFTRDR